MQKDEDELGRLNAEKNYKLATKRGASPVLKDEPVFWVKIQKTRFTQIYRDVAVFNPSET